MTKIEILERQIKVTKHNLKASEDLLGHYKGVEKEKKLELMYDSINDWCKLKFGDNLKAIRISHNMTMAALHASHDID